MSEREQLQQKRESHSVYRDPELDESVCAKRVRQAPGQASGNVASDAEAEHERDKDRGDGRAGGAEHKSELARPDDLIDEATHAGERE